MAKISSLQSFSQLLQVHIDSFEVKKGKNKHQLFNCYLHSALILFTPTSKYIAHCDQNYHKDPRCSKSSDSHLTLFLSKSSVDHKPYEIILKRSNEHVLYLKQEKGTLKKWSKFIFHQRKKILMSINYTENTLEHLFCLCSYW